MDYEGGLSDEMIADGLSQLGRSADGAMQVYLTLFLPVSQLFTSINKIEFDYSFPGGPYLGGVLQGNR